MSQRAGWSVSQVELFIFIPVLLVPGEIRGLLLNSISLSLSPSSSLAAVSDVVELGTQPCRPRRLQTFHLELFTELQFLVFATFLYIADPSLVSTTFPLCFFACAAFIDAYMPIYYYFSPCDINRDTTSRIFIIHRRFESGKLHTTHIIWKTVWNMWDTTLSIV